MNTMPYILTGGPGTGKSTVLTLLESAGCICVPESARDIIRSRRCQGLHARPSPKEFADEILAEDIERYQAIPQTDRLVFIDRGIVDALCMLVAAEGIDIEGARRSLQQFPMNRRVFFFSPWRAIFREDEERDQSYRDCIEVSERLAVWYRQMGFTLIDVPHLGPQGRAEFILNSTQPAQQGGQPDAFGAGYL